MDKGTMFDAIDDEMITVFRERKEIVIKLEEKHVRCNDAHPRNGILLLHLE